MQSRFERRPEGPRPGMAQDPISGILLPTDENIGSRMKTCLSIIDSYDEIWILYFLPIYLFYDEFRVGAWDMFLSQLNFLHWSGFVGWNRWSETGNHMGSRFYQGLF
jgi:hypothetical protein